MAHVKIKAPRSVFRQMFLGPPAQEIKKKNDTETLFVVKIWP